MKKLLLLSLLWLALAPSAIAQNLTVKKIDGKKELYLAGDPFVGTRNQMLALETTILNQPQQEFLAILQCECGGTTDERYVFIQYSDKAWREVASYKATPENGQTKIVYAAMHGTLVTVILQDNNGQLYNQAYPL